MNKTIGIDVDDVTLDLVTAWLHRYNCDHNDFLVESDIKSWGIGSYTKIGRKFYDYLKDPNLYAKVRPIENSLSGVQSLNDMGFRVIFITASTTEQSGVKYNILYNCGFLNRREDYYEAKDKSLIACDYLVDDNPDNVKTAYGEGIIYTREWNKSLIGYPRVDNWLEIINYFSKIKNTFDIIGV